MSTEWVVTTAAERVTLNEKRQGETTFTVTNPAPHQDRAVFEVVPGDGADSSWFSVEEPQRVVRSAASVSYLVRAAVPTQVPPGEYVVQGRVYSADSAPEESSVLSSRVMVQVAPAAAPPKRQPWWLIVVAAVLAVALIVVTALLVTRTGSGQVNPPPTTPPITLLPTIQPTQAGAVVVPDVTRMTADQAKETLDKAGLVGVLRYRFVLSTNGLFLVQSVTPGTSVIRGTTVEVVVPATASAPSQLGPGNNTVYYPTALPQLTWSQAEPYITAWRVRVYQYTCYYTGGNTPICSSVIALETVVREKSMRPTLAFSFRPDPFTAGIFHSGNLSWSVVPVDDFGSSGSVASGLNFQIYH